MFTDCFKIILSYLTMFLVTVVFAETNFPVLEKLVKQQKYQLAYELAKNIRSQNEGDSRFDYLYGFIIVIYI